VETSEEKRALTPQRREVARWHAEPVDRVLATLESSADGLDSGRAQTRLAEVGPNVLPRPTREGVLTLLWRQINSPLIYVLLGSGILAIALGRLTDGAVVLGVVALNTLIGFVQEFRAGKAIESLVELVPELCTVLRDGRKISVEARELVPGDIVLLQSGDRVPADMRIIALKNLHAEEASLTGESLPSAKQVEPVPADAAIGDRKNMAYGGTMISSGTGEAVVVATGQKTELGRISSMLHETTRIETPLTRSLGKVAKALTVAISAVALLIVGVAWLRGYSVLDAVLAGISLAVAAIPEGLPAIITIALAIGVRRMAARRAVIRKLPAVETLGSTVVICSDKTGTLTRNEMTVQSLVLSTGRYTLSGVGYAPEGELSHDGERLSTPPASVAELLRAATLCNDATLHRAEGRWTMTGDPTEGALVVAAAKVGIDVEAIRGSMRRIDAIPFESEHKYMATLHHGSGGRKVMLMKGAPEAVVARCRRLAGGHAIDADVLAYEVDRMASQGMRVLAIASREVEAGGASIDESDVKGGFTLLGLCGMIDPPRPEAIDAVEAFKEAGITVKMITGDHHATAKSIGVTLGLISDRDHALTGTELDELSDEQLRSVAAQTHVFARVAPEHKLRLVRALQAKGAVVAMTGDGVNDAPALKQADIGVAMGITGTAAAKQAADIVLTDDNFATIRAAVEEGRRVYDNLIKSLAFVLPTNLGEALIILIAVMFFPIVGGMPLMPILPVQILWINLVATVALALPLAFEAMEPSLMRRPPRRPDEPVLNRFVLFRTVVVAVLMTAGATGLFLFEYGAATRHGVAGEFALREAQTMAVTTVILFQIMYLMNCRSLRDSILEIGLGSNPWVYVGAGALLLLQIAFTYVPVMNELFGSEPLDFDAWVKSALVALTVLPVISLEKWWRKRRSAAATRRAELAYR